MVYPNHGYARRIRDWSAQDLYAGVAAHQTSIPVAWDQQTGEFWVVVGDSPACEKERPRGLLAFAWGIHPRVGENRRSRSYRARVREWLAAAEDDGRLVVILARSRLVAPKPLLLLPALLP